MTNNQNIKPGIHRAFRIGKMEIAMLSKREKEELKERIDLSIRRINCGEQQHAKLQ